MTKKIAIQGEAASFHDIAARHFFGSDIQIIPCKLPFNEVFRALEKTEYAVCAIETSLYGQINEVYDLLLENNARIVGEVYIRTAQNLLGTSDATIENIKEIHSHPVAIAECLPYIKSVLPTAKIIETTDTAASARKVAKLNAPSIAAIAGVRAAKLHGLKILAKDIDHENYTRFVVLSKNVAPVDKKANKTSLVLKAQADTKPGALHKALSVFANKGLNLTLLHSRPRIKKAWHYMFYIDVVGGVHDGKLNEALEELRTLGDEVHSFGSYPSGKVY